MKFIFYSFAVVLLHFNSCTIPVTPEFDIKEGLISVDAFVSNFPGASYVKIHKVNQFNIGINDYINVPEKGALVSFINSKTGEIIKLNEEENDEVYLSDFDFAASEGDTWELHIKLVNGNEYRSLPEAMESLIEISNLSVLYETEIEYNISAEDYVPGHSIRVIFNDPPDKENFYFWSYRTFEKNIICQVCPSSTYFRNGECEQYSSADPDSLPEYFTYYCDADCWNIRYGNQVIIFADEFIDGNSVDLPVADILLYNKENILVEIQQYAVSKSAYKYYEILKDIVDDSNSLNAPPPSPLLGNLYNPNDDTEIVLGRFTVASGSEKRVMIRRATIKENAIEPLRDTIPERSPIAEDLRIYTAPCGIESRFLTNVEPYGWEE